jgi:hypothetical protein
LAEADGAGWVMSVSTLGQANLGVLMVCNTSKRLKVTGMLTGFDNNKKIASVQIDGHPTAWTYEDIDIVEAEPTRRYPEIDSAIDILKQWMVLSENTDSNPAIAKLRERTKDYIDNV